MNQCVCGACSRTAMEAIVAVPDFEYARAGEARYGVCGACGSFTQVPMPDPAQLAAAYPAAYHSFMAPSRISRIRQNMRVARLGKLADLGGDAQTVLDFGCGRGLFLDALADAFPRGRFFGYEIGDR